MLKKEVYAGLVPMATFDDALYKVTGIEDTGENERYLISTTEHPLIAMFSDKTLKEEELPIKLAGLSAAFRKEAGAWHTLPRCEGLLWGHGNKGHKTI